MQELIGTIRRAIQDYDMVADGDKIAIGISGGKDSMALLEGLYLLKKHLKVPIQLLAVTIDPCFNGEPGDFSLVENFCEKREIPYLIHRSNLAEIIFEIRKEKNPCSLCARMRRGMLHDIAKAEGCNKLALGHHQDDATETLIMNLFQEGRIGCFQPVTYLSRKDLTMIRPMVFLTERQIVNAVKRSAIPVIPSGCPANGITTRAKTKQFLTQMEAGDYPVLRKNLFSALRKSGIDSW